MTGEELVGKFEELAKRKTALIRRKNSDYAKNGDAFSNFKRSSEEAGITVIQSFLHLIGIKRARLKELLSGKIPQNESITDTLVDLSNYADLLNIYLSDQEAKKQALREGYTAEREAIKARRAGVEIEYSKNS